MASSNSQSLGVYLILRFEKLFDGKLSRAWPILKALKTFSKFSVAMLKVKFQGENYCWIHDMPKNAWRPIALGPAKRAWNLDISEFLVSNQDSFCQGIWYIESDLRYAIHGVASLSSRSKFVCNPETCITRIRGGPKDYCPLSKLNTLNMTIQSMLAHTSPTPRTNPYGQLGKPGSPSTRRNLVHFNPPFD